MMLEARLENIFQLASLLCRLSRHIITLNHRKYKRIRDSLSKYEPAFTQQVFN